MRPAYAVIKHGDRGKKRCMPKSLRGSAMFLTDCRSTPTQSNIVITGDSVCRSRPPEMNTNFLSVQSIAYCETILFSPTLLPA